MTASNQHKRPVDEMFREALDYAQQTLDETLPYEESWYFIAEAYVRLFEQLEAAQTENAWFRKVLDVVPGPFMIPNPEPPPPEAIEMGRKLMGHYGRGSNPAREA